MESRILRRFLAAGMLVILTSLLLLLPVSRQAEAAQLAQDWQCKFHAMDAWQPFDYPQLPQELTGGSREIWLRVTLQPGAEDQDTLLFMTFMQSVRLWVNDRLIYHYGSFEQARIHAGQRWHIVQLPPLHESAELRIQVAADTEQTMRGLNTLTLGTGMEQAQKPFLFDLPIVFALPGAVLIILLMLLCYRYNPYHWQRLYLALIVFMLTFSWWLIAASNSKNAVFDDALFWWYALSITAYLLPLAANLVLYEILRHERGAHPGWIIAMNFTLLCAAVGGDLMGRWSMNTMMRVYYPLLVVTEACMAWWLIKAYRRGNILSRAILPALIGFTICGTIDGITGHFHILPWRLYFTPLGIFPLMYFIVHLLRIQLARERSLAARTARLEYKVAQATERSERDNLTGCYNRAAGKRLFELAKQQTDRMEMPMSLIMLDIDHFKHFNDTYGHATGDKILQLFTQALREELDKERPLIRWGGEEFIVICPGMSQMETAVLANELRRHVVRLNLHGCGVTCSLGVSIWHDKKDTFETLVKRADRALYQAKSQGRNRVVSEMDLQTL